MLHMRTKLFAAGLIFPLLFASVSWAGSEPPLGEAFRDSFQAAKPDSRAPDTPFAGAEGKQLSFDDFKGRVLLVNFWATWCAPCVREMPALDRLQAALADEGLTVVTVSNDRGGEPIIRRFYEEHGLQNLGIYSDPRNKLAAAFGVRGLPSTFFVDADGRLLGLVEGPAEWDEADAIALARYFLQSARERGLLAAESG